jgi:L-threonylcarbamoyladenylate synthase
VRIVGFGPDAYEREAAAVAEHLRAGGLIAYPTETVYGLGCALNEPALDALARLKRRDPGKPFLLLVLDGGQAPGLTWTGPARELARSFWPGPLTLILRARPGAYPGAVVADGRVAIRATPHPGVRAILRALGGPITSTSANAPGGAPATDAAQVRSVLESPGSHGSWWLLDAGPLPASAASTIVDCAGDRPRVVRTGAVPIERLRAVVEEIDV